MIINKETGTVQINANFPNHNWMGDDYVLVPQELRDEVMEHAPYINLEFDEDGKLVGVSDNGQRPEPQPEPPSPMEVYGIMLARMMGADIELTPEMLDVAMVNVELPQAEDDKEWRVWVRVEKGQRVTLDGYTFEVMKDHITQPDWRPEITLGNLFKRVQGEPPVGYVLPWISGERVYGLADVAHNPELSQSIRKYNDVAYICIIGHTTQLGFEPPNVPALWNVWEDAIATEPAETPLKKQSAKLKK